LEFSVRHCGHEIVHHCYILRELHYTTHLYSVVLSHTKYYHITTRITFSVLIMTDTMKIHILALIVHWQQWQNQGWVFAGKNILATHE